jgi:hypothetical protein
MNHIELNRRFPLSIVDSPSQLVVFGYAFVPEVVKEDRELSVLSVAPNGSSVSLITKKKSSRVENEQQIESEHCLTGTANQNQTDYALRISDENETFQLLPVSALSGLKRDRKNDFLQVNDSVSKSARTSLKQKTRTISQKRRKARPTAAKDAAPVSVPVPVSAAVPAPVAVAIPTEQDKISVKNEES